MAVDKSKHLNSVLESHKMKHIFDLVEKHRAKRDEIKEAIEKEYTSKIYTQFNSGSFGKHTAINTKFDLDIVVPFKRDSFLTIKDMFDDVHDFLHAKYQEPGIAIVRKQKVSIGVLFNADANGDEINIDVVPGREIIKDNYLTEKSLNIYFNEDAWGFSKGTYIKTNIQAQIDHIKQKTDERKIIRLLKIWKNTNRENYKSFLLELLTIKAFIKTDISGNIWEQLKGVMTYIKDNVNKDGFTLKDPGNSNNDILKPLSSFDLEALSNRMNTIINRVEENSENIKTYFPVNEAYAEPEEDSETSSYGIKGSAVGPSIPSNNQRFG